MNYLCNEDIMRTFYIEMMEAIKGSQEDEYKDPSLIEEILIKLTEDDYTPVEYDQEFIQWMMNNVEEEDIRDYIVYKGIEFDGEFKMNGIYENVH